MRQSGAIVAPRQGQRGVDVTKPSRITGDLLRLVGEKWPLVLVAALYERPHRYSQLRRRIRISAKTLSRALRLLEARGLAKHVEFPAIRRRVYYELTPAGRELQEFVTMFVQRFDQNDVSGRGVAPRSCLQMDRFTPEDAQSSTPDGDRRNGDLLLLRVVSITVRDLSAATRLFETILGAQMSEPTEAPITPRGAVVRFTSIKLAGFLIHLVQPVEGLSPHRHFIKRFGGGIHHLGLFTKCALEPLKERLAGRSVTQAGVNRKAADYLRIDCPASLGVAFAVYAGRLPVGMRRRDDDVRLLPRDALARQRLTNVGIVVRDIGATIHEYADLLGRGMTPIRTVDLPLPGAQTEPNKARISYLRQKGVTIKLLEAQNGPLRALARKVGNRAHHIGFEVGEHFSAILARLEAAGGAIVAGRRDCGYVLVDFKRQLGIAIELNGLPATSHE
jgi:DNA-binding HxlR family transcriptional regulator/catechol 2,3-dioxygenase-like lactoylglutathione lyase family enzyme